MKSTRASETETPKASRLSHAAKISDYRLRKVVAQYVRDHTSAEAARATGLSVNSAHALYRKLRVFFFDVRLFLNYYDTPEALGVENDEAFERGLLSFYLRRRAAKRGLPSNPGEPDYHFAETCWRYDFAIIMHERPSEAVYAMMERHLMELIRTCGPIGVRPRNLVAGAAAVMRQADERIMWLLRNAPGFRSPKDRDGLAEALAITDET